MADNAHTIEFEGVGRGEAFKILEADGVAIDDEEELERLVELVGTIPDALHAVALRLQAFEPDYVIDWLQRAPREVVSAHDTGAHLIDELEARIDDLSDGAKRIIALGVQFPEGIEISMIRPLFFALSLDGPSGEEAVRECVDQRLLLSTSASNVRKILPLARLLLRTGEDAAQYACREHVELIGGYIELFYDATVQCSDDELVRRLDRLERHAESFLRLLQLHVEGRFSISSSPRSKLFRLVVEQGMRRATSSAYRGRLTTLAGELSQRSELTDEELESLGRWWQRIGKLSKSSDAYARILDRTEPPPRVYWRFSEVLRLQKDTERLDEVVREGLQRLDEMDAPSTCCERLALWLSDSRSSSADDALAVEAFHTESLHSLEGDALHGVDCFFEAVRRISRRHWICHDFEEQRRILQPALTRAERLGDRGWIPLLRQGIGSSIFSNGDLETSLTIYGDVLQQYEAIGHLVGVAVLTGAMAAIHHFADELDEALPLYRRSIDAHGKLESIRDRHFSHYGLGCLLFETGQFRAALKQLESARKDEVAFGDYSEAGRTALVEAWIETWAGDPTGAQRRLEESRRHFQKADPHHWLPLVELSAHKFFDQPANEQDWERWRARIGDAPPQSMARFHFAHLADRSVSQDVIDRLRAQSLAFRVLLQITESSDRCDDGEDPDLVVGPMACWFQLSRTETIDIRARDSVRRILRTLVEMHLQNPGEGLDVHELFQIGWPDEEATPDSAANRVYWAIRTLRKLGLKELLLTGRDGYLLDPTSQITYEDNGD